ncbi:quinone-dependent dihydroorotate dehydrogenase [Roseospira marina]|uniref:Dihydroorotate dehydrogenase (quinone) n=1 Tax=Roseospira marina TaxID=140057 RepID=A0A5M6ICD4_9PROT|nr:quinone-dependent dihydroorotate dehydrogenase [Roseospira marina]KAA5605940.1 quinone-dependent dihydroorotate dehydrogenase [Roseospira marina]MBB4313217.1 dihydroorotate dehydrogenase [Roseospira marina]MBB5086042.1 dihydroorotate dehydrogenase [Roseospira marina]
MKSVDSMFLGLLHAMDPEKAHDLSIRTLARGMGPTLPPPDDPALGIELWGKRFNNPLGLAAGYDKNALVPDACLRMGFGFVEVGGITPRPQPGNPRPRLFRLQEDGAVINRMGLNNDGMLVAYGRLSRRPRWEDRGFVGVNLAKNADTPLEHAADDYATLAAVLGPHADFLVLNLSSPNTEGLRQLQAAESLRAIIRRTRAAMPTRAQPPLCLKVSPDLTDAELDDIARIALEPENPLDGIIAINTTTARPDSLTHPAKQETGGLSGAPLKGRALEVLHFFVARLYGRVPVISVGGVDSAADVLMRLKAGASAVQMYTALAYFGPRLIPKLKAELLDLMRAEGFETMQQVVGADRQAAAA